MQKRLIITCLALMIVVGCTSMQSRSQNNLKEYLRSHVDFCSEKDGLVTSITDQHVSFEADTSRNARATVKVTVQIGPREGVALSRALHQYTLDEIDGTWTVVGAKTKDVSSEDAKWVNNFNFHRQSDPVFSGLPWNIE